MLVSSHWELMAGPAGTAQSCARGGSVLPTEVVDAPCLPVFRWHLDSALNNKASGLCG